MESQKQKTLKKEKITKYKFEKTTQKFFLQLN